MAHELGMALSMTASGSLAHRQILHDISSKLTASSITCFIKNDKFISSYNTSISVKNSTWITVEKYCMALIEMHFDICSCNGSLSRKGS